MKHQIILGGGIDWIRQHRHLQEALAHTAIEPKYRVLAHICPACDGVDGCSGVLEEIESEMKALIKP